MSASTQNPRATPPTAKSNHSTIDGGLTALGGFYLQFVGTVDGTITDFWVDEDSDPAPDTDKNLIFGIEIADSDAFSRQITPEDHLSVRLVQFKFSIKPDAETVTPKEFAEILDKMEKFVLARFPDGRSEGRHVEVEFIMATNRPRSRDMEELWENRSNLSHSVFSTYNYAEYPGFHENLRKCRWQMIHVEDCHKRLQNWGRNFGLTETQIDEGTLKVTNHFTARVAEGRRLFTLSDVEKEFTGYDTPLRLDSPDTRKVIQDDVRAFIDQLRVPLMVDAVADADEQLSPLLVRGTRSTIFKDLEKAIAERSLVLLTGEGGNGKSTLLATLLNSWAEKQFVSGNNLKLLTDDWIIGRVERWRGEERRLDKEPLQAVSRLFRFRNEHPVLLLALDALDEKQMALKKQGELTRLLLFFAKEDANSHLPRVTLVVTCRKREDLDQFLGESGNEQFASDEVKNPGKEILVESFSPADLRFLLERQIGYANLLGDEARSRLLSSLEESTLSGTVESDDLVLPRKIRTASEIDTFGPPPIQHSAKAPVDTEILTALLHPIVWGFFCRVLKDEAIQVAALSGDSDAWGQISEAMLHWFSQKCEKRCSVVVSPEEVREILLRGAVCCGEFGTSHTSQEWRKATNNVASSNAIPIVVLHQAISSGLAKGNPQSLNFSWEWRHPFWARYLYAHAQALSPLL